MHPYSSGQNNRYQTPPLPNAAQQRYIYPPPNAIIYQPTQANVGRDANTSIFELTPETTGSNLALGPGPQAYALSAHGLYPPTYPPLSLYPFVNAPGHQPHPLHYVVPTYSQPNLNLSVPTRHSLSIPETHDHSPPPPTHTPPELTALRLQSCNELTQIFHDHEAKRYDTPPGNAVSAQQCPSLQGITEMHHTLLTYGQSLQQKLLSQVQPAAPNPNEPHRPRGAGQPTLSPTNVYGSSLQPTLPAPGDIGGHMAPSSHWHAHQSPTTPGHPHAQQPMHGPVHTPQPPLTIHNHQPPSGVWNQPAPPPARTPSAGTAPAWPMARRLQELTQYHPHMPLPALKLLQPLSTCADRHSMGSALTKSNLELLPDVLEWLRHFDEQKSYQLAMYVLLHFVNAKDIVPRHLTTALTFALLNLKEWPQDVENVGDLLSQLKQQPNPVFYEAMNGLIGRLLCRKQ